MIRVRFPRLWIAAIAASVLLAPAPTGLHAQNFDTVQVTSTKVAGNVHMLVGSGGNIGLMAGDDAAFVVDDQFAPLTPKTRNVASRGLRPPPRSRRPRRRRSSDPCRRR